MSHVWLQVLHLPPPASLNLNIELTCCCCCCCCCARAVAFCICVNSSCARIRSAGVPFATMCCKWSTCCRLCARRHEGVVRYADTGSEAGASSRMQNVTEAEAGARFAYQVTYSKGRLRQFPQLNTTENKSGLHPPVQDARLATRQVLQSTAQGHNATRCTIIMNMVSCAF